MGGRGAGGRFISPVPGLWCVVEFGRAAIRNAGMVQPAEPSPKWKVLTGRVWWHQVWLWEAPEESEAASRLSSWRLKIAGKSGPAGSLLGLVHL